MIRPSRRLSLLAVLACLPLLAGAGRPVAGQAAFADPAFQRLWAQTDSLVADGSAARSWYWGPAAGPTLQEPEAGAPGGRRLVQYFDKARMEINDPGADPAGAFYVTTGLLAVELMTGQMQLGPAEFQPRCPAAIPLASDSDDPTAPTYATFGRLMAEPQRQRVGEPAITVTDRAGTLHADASKEALPGVTLAYWEPATGRNIPQVFWDFLNASGPIVRDGQRTSGPLNQPWFYASGLPVTEAYWARVKVAGTPHDVLIQAFQRRVLTYIPDYNGSPFNVQMGNVGLHYYDWRYHGVGCAGPPPDIPRFAIDPTADLAPENVAALQMSGAQLVRLWFSWANMDPDGAAPPAYHWADYDALLDGLAAARVGVIAEVAGCPAWACTTEDGPVDKVAPVRFGQFMAAAAARYSKPPYNVHYWEVFNEPDTTSGPQSQYGFGLHGDQYAALLRAAVPGVRAADPQARVLLGGLGYEWFMDEQPPGPFNRNFLRDVVAAGGADYFDYLNFHYYPQNPHWPSIADKAAALQTLEAGLGLAKPLVCTESGLTSSPDPRFQAPGWPVGSEEVQSRFLVRMYAEGLGAGVRSITWFRLRDPATGPRPWEVFRMTGLLRDDGSAKPAFTAYQTLVREIADRPFLRRLDAAALGSPDATGYAFGGEDGEVWVVWSRTDSPAVVTPGGPPGARAYDMLGAAVPLKGGALPVGPNPVYLEIPAGR